MFKYDKISMVFLLSFVVIAASVVSFYCGYEASRTRAMEDYIMRVAAIINSQDDKLWQNKFIRGEAAAVIRNYRNQSLFRNQAYSSALIDSTTRDLESFVAEDSPKESVP